MTFVTHDARRLRIDHDFHHDRLSERSYLFTMSDITHPHEAFGREALGLDDGCGRLFSREQADTRLVEPDGIEPTTSCLQSRRSPN
jgi:hypothetical protein